ncbi:hypothetical protein NHX12_017302, partial [Muraenolepis orangiensis]
MPILGSLTFLGKAAAALTQAFGVTEVKYIPEPGDNKTSIRERQEKEILDSSEVEEYLHLGEYGSYRHLTKNERPFVSGEEGDKRYVEADHIPPLDSMKRARSEAEFPRLRLINPALYNMVNSLFTTDLQGMELFAIQVSTHHHRQALSSGNSLESQAV